MKIKSTGDDRRPWMTDEYVAYLQSPEWAAIRADALERAGHRCEYQLGRGLRCDETRGLEVHHRRYGVLGFERADDLQVLCRHHHRLADVMRRGSARLTTLRQRYGDWRPSR